MISMSDLVELAQKVNNINSRHPITYTRDNLIRKGGDKYNITMLASPIDLLYLEISSLAMVKENIVLNLFEFRLKIKSVTLNSLQFECDGIEVSCHTDGDTTTYSIGDRSVKFVKSKVADLYELLKVSHENK